jgi:large-conductance mechanosensitive channel
MSIIDDLIRLPIRLIDKIRVFVEYLANWIEMGIWRTRDPLIFTLIALILLPIIKIGWNELNSIKFKNISSGNYENEFKNILNHQANELSYYNQIYLLIVAIVIGVVLFEMVLQYVNFRKRKKSKTGVITIVERFFACLAYFWVGLEMTSMYLELAIDFLKRVIPTASTNDIYSVIGPVIQWYTQEIPGAKYGIIGYMLFILFFYGIGRNRNKFKFFIRYHFIQAVLLLALFGFQGHIYFFWSERNNLTQLVEFVGITIYSIVLSTLSLTTISAILGVETKIPFVHDAIQFHTGRKEDQDKGLLDS